MCFWHLQWLSSWLKNTISAFILIKHRGLTSCIPADQWASSYNRRSLNAWLCSVNFFSLWWFLLTVISCFLSYRQILLDISNASQISVICKFHEHKLDFALRTLMWNIKQNQSQDESLKNIIDKLPTFLQPLFQNSPLWVFSQFLIPIPVLSC